MKSNKAFLERGPNGPRITADQQRTLRRAFAAIFFYSPYLRRIDGGEEMIKIVDRIATGMLDAYPVDRSCATCDYEADHGCLFFAVHPVNFAEIPDANFETGCDNHKSEGAPF